MKKIECQQGLAKKNIYIVPVWYCLIHHFCWIWYIWCTCVVCQSEKQKSVTWNKFILRKRFTRFTLERLKERRKKKLLKETQTTYMVGRIRLNQQWHHQDQWEWIMLLTNSQDYDNNKNIGNVFFFVQDDIFFYRYTRKRADAQYYVLVHIHWNHNTFLNNNNVVGDHAPCMHNMAEHVSHVFFVLLF